MQPLDAMVASEFARLLDLGKLTMDDGALFINMAAAMSRFTQLVASTFSQYTAKLSRLCLTHAMCKTRKGRMARPVRRSSTRTRTHKCIRLWTCRTSLCACVLTARRRRCCRSTRRCLPLLLLRLAHAHHAGPGEPRQPRRPAASAHIDSCSAADAAGYALSLGVTHSSADQHEAQMGLHARTRAHTRTL